MNQLFLIQHPHLFQGEKYLNNNKNYFEGWYFKNTKQNQSIAFIPGININSKNKKAFIQVITNASSYFVNYAIKDFQYSTNPFYIKIKNNYFSKEKLHIEMEDELQNLKIHGDIQYHHHEDIKTSFVSPNIMGPFSYIPFMECNHAILCMKTHIQGNLQINGENINLDNGIGYIEKDWGKSFPKSYIWCQANCFQKTEASFMLSIADIPFPFLNFKGMICVLLIQNQEYRFATYNHTQIKKYEVSENLVNITLKKGRYELNIRSINSDGKKLLAPVKGKMEKEILESIGASLEVTLRKKNTVIFQDTSTNCGLEIV